MKDIKEHGGNIYKYDIKYDFSANINPLGITENIKNALINSLDLCDKYPEPYSEKLVSAIAECKKISDKKIVCGNGASDLIYRIISYFKPEKSLIFEPSFSEYEKALRESESECEVIKYYLSPEKNFIADESFLDLLDESIDMLIIGNPNNPTGLTLNPELMERVSKKCIENDIYFLCDECFIDFIRNSEKVSAYRFINKNMIILKAFTKIYAMAGIRLGYAVFGDENIAEKIKTTGQCWSVSVPAQYAGITALKETDYIENTIRLIESERRFLTKNIKKLGIKVFKSEVNFILCYSDFEVYEMLKSEKIAVRNCENFDGLNKKFFRIAVRSNEENIILIDALRRCLNG